MKHSIFDVAESSDSSSGSLKLKSGSTKVDKYF